MLCLMCLNVFFFLMNYFFLSGLDFVRIFWCLFKFGNRNLEFFFWMVKGYFLYIYLKKFKNNVMYRNDEYYFYECYVSIWLYVSSKIILLSC